MTSEDGYISTSVATPITTQPASQPAPSTIGVSTSGGTIPPIEVPSEASAITRPRLITNHLESVVLTTNGPIMKRPTCVSAPRTKMNCHSSSTCETATSATPLSVVPISMIGRAP